MDDAISEVLVVSDAGNKGSNCIIYDLKNGSSIFSFKEGNSAPKGLSFIAEDYLISAFSDKPMLKVWPLSKRNNDNILMYLPGPISCLAVAHCGSYCTAGIDKNIYLWEISSGTLLSLLSIHSHQVSCLRFTTDGTFLISGGKDGVVYAWLLPMLVDATCPHDKKKPYYTWSDHSGEITDIYVGKLGCYARVATVSQDMTCKIYELESGKQLTAICTNYQITAVVMDNAEYFVILGSAEGYIHKVNLFSVRDGEVHHTSYESQYAFVGHTASITSLSLSTNGTYLLSGSEDSCCKLWDMSNFSCLRTVRCDGAVTNAFIALFPPGLKVDRNYISQLPVSKFHKQLEEDSQHIAFRKISDKNLSLAHTETPDQYFEASMLEESSDTLNDQHKSKSRVSIQELETINQQLYAYALCDLVSQRSAEQADAE